MTDTKKRDIIIMEFEWFIQEYDRDIGFATHDKEVLMDALALLKAQEQKCRECGEATSKAIQELQTKLKAHEPRTCSECRHYDTAAFTDMGGKCRNSRSCHYCYGCDKTFGCNAWEGR